MSAFTALIAPDESVFEYLNGRRFAPTGNDWELALAAWQNLASDEDALFDSELTVDAGDVAPTVTWGTSPQHALQIGDPVTAHSDIAALTTRKRSAERRGGKECGRTGRS